MFVLSKQRCTARRVSLLEWLVPWLVASGPPGACCDAHGRNCVGGLGHFAQRLGGRSQVVGRFGGGLAGGAIVRNV